MPTILVIDDERLLCDLLQEMLRRQGHEVFTAYSGQEGIQAFQRHRPQFTLLDLHLPDMNGIEALTRIREHDPKAVAMILTGAGSDKLEREARELGVTDFLIKGLSPEVLISAVARGVQPPPPAEACSSSHEEQNGASILVVDDERQICELLEKYLAGLGFRVRTAQDGLSALALVDIEQPLLIILDIYMPGMNGIAVLRKLRAKKFPGGVMMLTGCEDQALLKEAFDLGSLDLIGKPFDLERIGLAVEVSLILAKKVGRKGCGVTR